MNVSGDPRHPIAAMTVAEMKEILNQLDDDLVLLNWERVSIVKPNDKAWFMWKPMYRIDVDTNMLTPTKPLKIKSMDEE